MIIQIDTGVKKFIGLLNPSSIAKTLRTIDLLETFGHRLSLPHSRSIGGNLFELRVHGEQEIRIFYYFQHGIAFLLFGYIKKSQKTPKQLIRRARSMKNAIDNI